MDNMSLFRMGADDTTFITDNLGGGFAISYPLAKALEKMQDGSIQRRTLGFMVLMIECRLVWLNLKFHSPKNLVSTRELQSSTKLSALLSTMSFEFALPKEQKGEIFWGGVNKKTFEKHVL